MHRLNFARTIQRADRFMVNTYEFLNNVAYYLKRGHKFRDAVRMARDTL